MAEPLKDQPSFLRCQVLYLWLAAYVAGLRDISTAHLEALDQLLAAQTGRRVELPYGLSVARIRRLGNAMGTVALKKRIFAILFRRRRSKKESVSLCRRQENI